MVTGAMRMLGRGGQARPPRLALMALAFVVALAGCDAFGSGKSDNTASGLGQVPWCDRPSITFLDSSAPNQTPQTHWDQVKDQLGFTPYLPPSLPNGACLVLAGGTLHDPVLGGNLRITWELPNNIPLSFSEAPKRPNLGDKLQCTASAQDKQSSVCLGVMGDTSITI